jgi:hypothetical protein
MNRFFSFFEDNTGGLSTMRAMFWLWLVILSFIIIWTSIHTKTIPSIDNSYITITGILSASKVGQRIFGEKI